MSSLQNFEAPFYRYPTPTTIEVSSEPFGYLPNPQNQSKILNGAPSALAESTNTFTQGCTNDNSDAVYTTPSTKSPIYFDSLRSTVGLVCGRENKTKYRVLNNLLAGGRKETGMQGSASKDILCFTAENGSFHIAQTVSTLLQWGESYKAEQDGVDTTDAIILAWPSNVSNLRAQHASSKNIKVLPLLVPSDEIKLEHLRHLYGDHGLGAQNANLDELLLPLLQKSLPLDEVNLPSLHKISLNSGGENASVNATMFLLSLNPYLSVQLRASPYDVAPEAKAPEWMQWIQCGQPTSAPQAQARRRVLCVDWTGCTPEEHRIQNVLADIILRQWHACASSHLTQAEQGGKALSTIVCDNAQHYLFEHEQSPFIRSLARLSYGSAADALVATRPVKHNVILLTESPLSIPTLLYDRMDFLVLHRLTSPGWLTTLERHFHLHSPQASIGAPSSSVLLDKIMDLDEEHVLLYAPPKPKAGSVPKATWGQQRQAPNSVSIGHCLAKICLSAEDHSHPVVTEREHPNGVQDIAHSAHSESDNGVFGVIGGSRRRNGTGEASLVQASPPSPSPYHIGAGDERGRLVAKGGLSSGHQQPAQSMNSSWAWRGDSTAPNKINAGPTITTTFREFATPNAVPSWSPAKKTTGSPPSSPFTPSDAVIARPINMARIPSSSSASASGLSFSFSGKSITPSSSAAAGSYSTGLATSPISPIAYFGAGRAAAASATFSPFLPPSMLGADRNRERETMGGTFDTGYSTSDSSSRYHVGGGMPMSIPMTMPMQASPHPNGNGRPNYYSQSGEGHARTETNASAASAGSRGSSSEYVDVGASGAGAGGFSRVIGARSPVPPGMENRPPLDFSATGGKRSYAGVAAPARESITSPQRRDTVVPPANMRPTLTTQGTSGLDTSSASGPSSSSDLISPSSSDPPPPPPIYPESFFWPLLDALEKSRAQVSTAHNRAQSVRHSVVGQELPQSARLRLGLTFKEYVAAASRQGFIVTGDSGDKAWIAMRDWKYPGKSFSWVSSPR